MYTGKFKKPENDLELVEKKKAIKPPSVPDEMFMACSACKHAMYATDFTENNYVCEKCGFHAKMSVRRRIEYICDENSFSELFTGLKSKNVIGFPEYDEKLKESKSRSGEEEGVVCGECEINKNRCCIFVMESQFMMGSMGSVVGEKITRTFEYATEKGLPVIGFTLSGGARMQEGIISLMQMAKTSGAVKRHSEAGNLYIAVLCDPTTGGVTASFAMEADITIAEPGALIGFAGPRVIEQTIKQKLPEGFQRAEMLLEKGFIDLIIRRSEQKSILGNLLSIHRKEVEK